MGVKGWGRRAFGLGFGLWQVEVSKPSPQQEGPALEGGAVHVCTSTCAEGAVGAKTLVRGENGGQLRGLGRRPQYLKHGLI